MSPGRFFRIALASFGILALELALIRWVSGQIRVFAYFNNLVLIACFLGLGLGTALGARRRGLGRWVAPAVVLLALPLAFAGELGIMHMPLPDPSIFLWGADRSGASALDFARVMAVLLAVFAALAGVFALAGAALGELLAGLQGPRAYAANLLGSLAGVLVFSGANALSATPPAWLLLGTAPFAALAPGPAALASLAAVAGLGQASVRGAVFSPYNRIDVETGEFGGTLSTNRDFHQYMHDLSDRAIASAAPGSTLRRAKREFRRVYDAPLSLGRSRGSALVIGAGTGNDAQAALRQGFGRVVSVDIDPQIVRLGRQLHPERPYGDPRVTAVVNDARAFLETYRGPPFDAVSYGFVDSHAMFSSLSTLRLDNYLYTEEGLRAAWKLVAPGGHMAVTLSLLAGDWFAARLYWTIASAAGVEPAVSLHGLHQGATFFVARDPALLKGPLAAKLGLQRMGPQTRATTRIARDDWPFLYFKPGVIPWAYLLILASLLVLAAASSFLVFGKGRLAAGFDPVLFLMGAGFLLLETRAVTSLSLLFGSTWVVNAFVFSGVLIVALAANALVPSRAGRHWEAPIFIGLLSALFLLWAVPPSSFQSWSFLARGAAGGLLNALPVFFSGVIVSSRLARSQDLGAALGSNLLGSVVGGCLEYGSMALGLRALVLLAMAVYGCAYWIYRRGLKSLSQ